MLYSYEEFKEIFKRQIKERMVTAFPTEKIRVVEDIIHEINESKEVLKVLINYSSEEPMIYVEKFYQECLAKRDFEGCMTKSVAELCRYVRKILDDPNSKDVRVSEDFELEIDKDKITLFLINTKANEKFLSNKPHKEFLDLSVVYTVAQEVFEGFVVIETMNYDHLKSLDISEEKLYEIAYKNTLRIHKPSIKPFKHKGVHYYDTLSYSIQDNKGAGAILYEELLYDYTRDMKTDVFLIPSSIHEWLILPTNIKKLKDVEQMV